MEEFQEDNEIYCLLVEHFQEFYHLSPLSSKIVSLMIFESNKDGYTFENLVEKLKTSKSSMSTNLNYLLKTNRIKYCTKPQDRKKYFHVTSLAETLNKIIRMIQSERMIMNRVQKYREHIDDKQCEVSAETVKIYMEHLETAEHNLTNTRDLIEKLNN
ncbi:MAG: hypothetical protein KBS98_02015 [Flavobacterium sp.]|nr:hypothetical protein [Candidatus Neoflavobacterium equi]